MFTLEVPFALPDLPKIVAVETFLRSIEHNAGNVH
jgi:hypothetical protein